MIIRQEVVALVTLLNKLDELLHRPEIVAQVEFPRGLNTGNNDFFAVCMHHNISFNQNGVFPYETIGSARMRSFQSQILASR